MMIMIIYTIFLFILLTPSILVKIPKKGNKYTVAFVHGLIFAIIYHFTHKMVHNIGRKENYRLYKDKDCKNVLAGPGTSMKKGESGDVWFNGIGEGACRGPFNIGD
jgi:hypothetical protein